MAASTTIPVTARMPVRSNVLYPHAQWWFLLAMMVTWIGFGRSYFAVIRTEPLLHHIHGALMGGWIGMLVLQPILYQRRQLTLHRLIGKVAAYAWLPGIVVCGLFMVRSMLRGTGLPPAVVDQLAFLDLTGLVLFSTFVGLAVRYRRNVQLHARYIACTVVLLMPPALVRAMFILPFLRFSFQFNVNLSMALMDFVLLVLIADDWRKGKIRAAYPVALLANTLVAVAANFAHEWGWWHALTGWIAA